VPFGIIRILQNHLQIVLYSPGNHSAAFDWVMFSLPPHGCFLQKALKDCNLPEVRGHSDIFSSGITLLFKEK
jgi:hypothetical protein